MARGERGTARPYLRGSTWWIRYTVPGEGQRSESTNSPRKADALRLLHQRLLDVDQRRIGPKGVTVGALLKLHLQDLRINRRASYHANEGYVRNHLLPAFGEKGADRLSTVAVTAFIGQKQTEGLANATINRCLEALRHSYHLGRDARPALVHVVPKIRMLTLDNVREGTLEHEDYRRLLGFLPFYLQMVLVIGYHYGMRRGEILALRWDQVDWEHAVIRLDRAQTKGKQARVAPLIGEVRAWLERAYLERREGEQTIISYRESDHVRRPGENAGRPRKLGGVFDQAAAWGVTPKTARRILSLNLEGDQLAEAVAAAQKSSASRRGFLDPGAEASRVVPSVARVVPSVAKPRAAGKPIQSIKTAWETARKAAGVPELLVHDLRRTAASNMLRAGLNEKEVMQILGHKTAAMLRRYNIVDERGMVEAARKMERYQAGLAVGGKKPIGGVSTKLVQGSEPVKLRKSGKGVIIQ